MKQLLRPSNIIITLLYLGSIALYAVGCQEPYQWRLTIDQARWWLMALGVYLLAQLLGAILKRHSYALFWGCTAIGVLFIAKVYAASHLDRQYFFWGFHHFQYFKPHVVAWLLPWPFVVAIPIINRNIWKAAVKAIEFLKQHSSVWNRRLLVWQLALLSFFPFWFLGNRNNHLGDAGPIMGHFAYLMRNNQISYVTFDEPLAWLLHGKFYKYMYHNYGWGQAKSYGLTTSLAGIVFIALVMSLARHFKLGTKRGILLTGLVLTGGYMQLFFRYVENYTIVTVCILGYLILVHRSLRDGGKLLWPALVLSLGTVFHLLAGWLYPTLAFAYLYQCKGRRWWRSLAELLGIIIATGIPFAIVLGYLVYGESVILEAMFKSSWAYKLNFVPFQASYADNYWLLSERHLLDIVNEHLLLAPLAWVFLGITWYVKRREIKFRDPFLIVLTIGVLFMLIYTLTWMPGLGGYGDWDLFSGVGFMLVLLLGWLMVQNGADGKIDIIAQVALPLIIAHLIHSGAWILSNHFHFGGY